jgi:AcrR family transcriptional regulator
MDVEEMNESKEGKPRERKVDRRKSRTRQALRDALLALILEEGYEAVKVEQITERANLGRTTFYLHYHDKEELFLESIHDLVADLVEQISRIPISAWALAVGAIPGDGYKSKDDEDTVQPIYLTFTHAAENADLYRIILRGEGAYKASRQLKLIITQAINDYFRVKVENENLQLAPLVPMEVFANYLAGAWMGTITWWLEQDMPYSPLEMTRMFQKILILGTQELLGIGIE